MIDNLEKIQIVNYKLSNLYDIYEATLIMLDNPQSFEADSDCTIEEASQFKLDLELQIEALKTVKESLTIQ